MFIQARRWLLRSVHIFVFCHIFLNHLSSGMCPRLWFSQGAAAQAMLILSVGVKNSRSMLGEFSSLKSFMVWRWYSWIGRSWIFVCDFCSPHLCVGFLFLVLHPVRLLPLRLLPPAPVASSHTTYSHTTCTHTTCNTQLTHTQLAHTHNLLNTQLTHTQLAQTQLSHTQLAHTHNLHTHNLHTHKLAHTQLAHTQLAHTQLAHTDKLHTHTQLTHTQLTHTQLVHTHNLHTHNLLTHTHTQLTHTQLAHTLCVAGVALCDIHLHFVWQAWQLCDIDLHFVWQAWHFMTWIVTLRGRRGTWWHPPSFHAAGVARMALGWLWWRAGFPRVAVVAAAVCVAGVALGDM